MTGNTPMILGLALLGLPPILLAWIAFRKQRPIFFFCVALILMGLGYLATTPTPVGFARAVIGTRL
jgi:predicted small integral membrane protein